MTEPIPETARPLDADERAELERLRAQVAEQASTRAERSGNRMLWRRIGAGVLVLLVALLTLASVTTRYVRSEILDSDHYLATVTPLASDPAVQREVSDTVAEQIDAQVDIQGITASALQQLVDLTPAERPRLDQAVVGLAPVIAAQAQSLIHQTVTEFVQSDAFKDLWVTANRGAHQAMVAAVTGDTQRGAVQVDTNSGTVSIQLGPVIAQVKQRLVDRGLSFADNIPQVNKEFVVFESADLAKAQRAVNALDKIASILPWLAIAAALGAIGIIGRGRRLRMLSIVGVAIVLSMLLLAIAILIGRAVYLNQLPPDVLAPDAAQAIFDTIIGPLRFALRAVAVLGLVIALVAFFAGGSRSATAVRRGFGRGVGALDARRSQRLPNAFERVLWQARIPARIAVVAVAAIVLMFWPYPTGLVVIWIVVLCCLVLVAMEIAMRPARREPGSPDEAPDEPAAEHAAVPSGDSGEQHTPA
ncbi:hypothetical protein [Gordonia insulae]|uniref:Integral membrane protein n=1 Tax=Gordonia insulae TaxID=2420509 RepID=A0A3G8JS46_9ACTN|nr:hypothetical protein [Gordonia insulae]AZG47369.1 hypothetical protein D7316_03978 [Gordonia insulae]